jgi:hypothetical protein
MSKCCKPILQGKMKELRGLTPLINEILMNDPIHMSKCAPYYNNAVSLCSTGVANNTGKGGFQHDYFGNHAVTIKGRTYHSIVEQRSGQPTSALGYVFFDELIRPNVEIADKVSEDYLQRIMIDLIEYNEFLAEIDFIGKQYDKYQKSILFNGNHMTIKNINDFVVNINNDSNFFDIGLLRMDAINERVIRFVNKEDVSYTIPVFSSKRHPLAYPLFFPNGQLGWGKDNYELLGHKLRMPEYTACRVLHLEKFKLPCLMDNSKSFLTSRFEAMPRLTQTMVVDDVSTMVDTVLKYTSDNQDMITNGYREDVQEEDVGK